MYDHLKVPYFAHNIMLNNAANKPENSSIDFIVNFELSEKQKLKTILISFPPWLNSALKRAPVMRLCLCLQECSKLCKQANFNLNTTKDKGLIEAP